MTSRPAHPDTHDPTVRERLKQAIEGEVIIRCRDKGTAALVRSRIWALVKAHRFWQTKTCPLISNLRTKLVDTYRVNALRPGANIDPEEHPFCLILDTRDEAAKALETAIISNAETPLTRSSEPATVSETLLDDDDENSNDDFYSSLTSPAYKGIL